MFHTQEREKMSQSERRHEIRGLLKVGGDGGSHFLTLIGESDKWYRNHKWMDYDPSLKVTSV